MAFETRSHEPGPAGGRRARASAATACRIDVCFLRLCPCRNSVIPDRSGRKRAPGIGTNGCSISGLVEHSTLLGARSNDDGVRRGERANSRLPPEMAAVRLAGDSGCPSRGCRESDPRESTQRSHRRGAASVVRSVSFVQGNHVVQHFPPTATHPSLSDTVLPRCPDACSFGRQSRCLQQGDHLVTEYGIVIKDHVLMRSRFGEGLA